MIRYERCRIRAKGAGTLRHREPATAYTRFVARLRTATALTNLTYQTEPMREAKANGQREAILDLGERRPIPDATETLARFQRMLDDHVVDDDPAPSGCSEEVLEPLRAARARANEILLGE